MNFFERTLIIGFVVSMSLNAFAQAQSFLPEEVMFAAQEEAVSYSVDERPAQYAPEDMAMPYDSMMLGGMYGEGMLPGNQRKVFIIPSTQTKEGDYPGIERDMHIMSHILDQILRKPQMIGGVFTVMDDFFGRDSHVTEVIYLDGYGALFFMEVSLVLTGAPESSEVKDQKQAENHTDAIWKRAELELYTPQDMRNDGENRSEQTYDAEKVEVLKKDLIEGLKHAANIRSLKSDDVVVLTVIGRSGKSIRNPRTREWTFQGGKWRWTGSSSPTWVPAASLTVRAKKADIDAFSKGEKDFDAFCDQTHVVIR
ncbi:MAG: hypothetical protein JXM79_01185 [Sedimentisphaerales bacterium]|nr:hypothetical protein [Sedimentisphaerales bacterium]